MQNPRSLGKARTTLVHPSLVCCLALLHAAVPLRGLLPLADVVGIDGVALMTATQCLGRRDR
jgi:hypothetical protein